MAMKQCYGNIRAVQMEKRRGLLGIKRMDRAPNARIREFCGVTKEVNEMIDEGVLRWFDYVEIMENEGIGERVCW